MTTPIIIGWALYIQLFIAIAKYLRKEKEPILTVFFVVDIMIPILIALLGSTVQILKTGG